MHSNKNCIGIGYITISIRWEKIIIVCFWFHGSQGIYNEYDHYNWCKKRPADSRV